MGKILYIANDLANRVKDDKRPYLMLKWLAENFGCQYGVSKSEMMEAYFAALNILKRAGVENAKRKPLTSLNKAQRGQMRRQAKEFAALLQRYLKVPVEVSRCPIQERNGNIPSIQIEIKTSAWCTLYLCLIYDDLKTWSGWDEANKAAWVYKFAQGYKSTDQQIAENFETIKAKLEASL